MRWKSTELFHLAQNRILEITLQIVIIEAEKVEDVWIFQHEIRCHLLRVAQVRHLAPDHFVGPARPCAALEQHRLHPLLQLLLKEAVKKARKLIAMAN